MSTSLQQRNKTECKCTKC